MHQRTNKLHVSQNIDILRIGKVNFNQILRGYAQPGLI